MTHRYHAPFTTAYCKTLLIGSLVGLALAGCQQEDVVFATWFTYDASGNASWLVADLRKSASGVFSGSVSSVSGPPFDAEPFDSSKVVETVVGAATVTFANGNSANLAYTVNGVTQTKAITRQVFVPPGTICH